MLVKRCTLLTPFDTVSVRSPLSTSSKPLLRIFPGPPGKGVLLEGRQETVHHASEQTEQTEQTGAQIGQAKQIGTTRQNWMERLRIRTIHRPFTDHSHHAHSTRRVLCQVLIEKYCEP